jgi:hypothetical protein
MTKLIWGNVGTRFYETGVDRGVLYLGGDTTGVPWNGLISVSESPSGGDAKPYYLDGIKYANSNSAEEFEATLEAYTYPEEFAVCDGTTYMAQGLFITQQQRRSFGLSYRTLIGNDIDAADHAYKLHIIYNAQANPASRDYATNSDDPEAMTFSWDITTRPVKFQDPAFGVKYGAHLVLDSRVVYPWAMKAVEDVLYGTADTAARLPSPQELLDLFVDNALLKITDNGDGTWTADGPDTIIEFLYIAPEITMDNADEGFFVSTTAVEDSADPGFFTDPNGVTDEIPDGSGKYDIIPNEFTIDWPSVIYLDSDTVQISSL